MLRSQDNVTEIAAYTPARPGKLLHQNKLQPDVPLPAAVSQPALESSNLRNVKMMSLMAADTCALFFAAILGYLVAAGVRVALESGVQLRAPSTVWSSTHLIFLVSTLLFYWKSWSFGHYTRFRPVWTEFSEILKLCAYFGLASIVMLYMFKLEFSRLWLGFFLMSLCCFTPLYRSVAKRLMMKSGVWLTPTYIVGVGNNAAMTAAALDSDISMGYRVDGFIDLLTPHTHKEFIGKPVHSYLPPAEQNRELCLVFAFESLDEMDFYRETLDSYSARVSTITIAPPVNGLPLCGAEVMNVFRHDTVLLRLQNKLNNRRARFTKRAFDLVVAISALVILSPLFILLYWLVGRDGGNPIYAHQRVGRDGRAFNCLKFRTMISNSNERLAHHLASDLAARIEWRDTHKLTNDPRVTALGRFLRLSSLDELPQLINVVRGEMSIVGPRPIVEDELPKYGNHLPYYLSMTPGITGLWQSSGRSDTSYKERVLLDVWYSRNWSVWHDIVIILRTVPALLNSQGAR